MARSAIASTKQLCLALPDLFGSLPLDDIAELAAIICQSPSAMALVRHPIWGEMKGASGIAPFVRGVSPRIESRGSGAGRGPFRGKTKIECLEQVPREVRPMMACFSGVPIRAGAQTFQGALWVFHKCDRLLSAEQWRGLWLLSRQLENLIEHARIETGRPKDSGSALFEALAHGLHDLKSPLSTVALEVGALNQRGCVTGAGAPRLARILSAVDRMHGIIHRLVDKTEWFASGWMERQIKKNQT